MNCTLVEAPEPDQPILVMSHDCGLTFFPNGCSRVPYTRELFVSWWTNYDEGWMFSHWIPVNHAETVF